MSTPSQLTLTPLSSSDLAEVFPLWSDYDTVKLTNWTHTPTREECAQRLEKVLAHYGREPRHFGPWMVRVEQRSIGLVGADLRDEATGEYEVWYVLRREEWGRGLATRAVGALLERMVTSGRVRRAVATVVPENVGSWKLLERHGFTRQELLPAAFQRHGLVRDLFTYARVLHRSDK
ncbi:MAG: GNAT family N-acetyltransferase [Myxococcota bacterium]